MIKILFQGDSITDCDRNRQNGADLGRGYPMRVASRLGLEKPGAYEFINRGIGADRVTDVYARIKCDILNLKPDVLSILVGVNDSWHDMGSLRGLTPEKFEKIYGMLIEEIKEPLPNIKIMLIEPFILKEKRFMIEREDGLDSYPFFLAEVKKRAAAARRVAEKYGVVFIPTQEKLDKLAEIQPPAYWLTDGVHPSPCGHEFLAREWIAAYKKHFE